jgi:hypothetical protein
MFLTGLAIIAHEVFFAGAVEPAAVAIGIALTGLPVALGADERRAR